MSNKELLNNIKKLRELTGVGFKDCKIAIEESNGDIDKSVEYLRKKGIAKASKKMERNASEGLVLVHEKTEEVAVVEINSETDFVAKNKDFLNFSKEICPSISSTNTSPSDAVLLIFLEALAIPFFLRNSIDFSISPLFSSSAILQSLKPTPVISLSFLILSNKSLFDMK